jgi:hypothetical protein
VQKEGAGFVGPAPKEGKGTCRFIQRVIVGARRAIFAQDRDDPEAGRLQNPEGYGGCIKWYQSIDWLFL